MQVAPEIYTDFTAFTELRKGAREQSPEAIKKVAQQFESLFVQMMLKSMRDTLPESELFGSKSEKMYQDMFDKQLSMQISTGRGIGLASTIERQLGGTPENNELSDKKITDYLANPRPVDVAEKSNVTLFKLRKELMGDSIDLQNKQNKFENNAEKNTWQNIKDFVKDIWPYAQRAANALGVAPDVLVAQSALETGWGKHTPKKSDGSNSFNVFGIKADTRWQGDKVELTTREYRHGVVQKEQASFRSYDSVADAFADYTNFILDNPRYQQALERGYDAEAYAKELQKAGYATDPNYAEKINRVRSNEVLQSQLKKLNKVPLT